MKGNDRSRGRKLGSGYKVHQYPIWSDPGPLWHDIHYDDVIMGTVASQITSLAIVYSTVFSGCRSKKTSKLSVTGLCAGHSPGIGEFPAQMASNEDNVFIWWRHYVKCSSLITNVKNRSDFEISKEPRYFALTCRPWGAYYEYIWKKVPVLWRILPLYQTSFTNSDWPNHHRIMTWISNCILRNRWDVSHT